MSTASFFRRFIVVAFALTISLVYTFVTFRGITTPDGMEKSQLAREIARGSYNTKMIRPIALWQSNETKEAQVSLSEVSKADTYNSPLYPILLGVIFKATGIQDFEKWKMEKGAMVYGPDRMIAGLSIFFFLSAVLLFYALACSLFDQTIGGIAAIILISCDLFWKFTHTGMPNSLMLLLFSAACFALFKASAKTSQDTTGYLPGILAGLCLVLLSLTHWMAAWILLGYLIFSFFFLRPRALISATTAIFALLAFIPCLLHNFKQTGNPFGTAFFTIYSGLGISSESIMRSTDIGDIAIPIRNVAFTFLRNSFLQVSNVYEYSGYLITAPLFFLSLIHRFKNAAVERFKWALLLMWVCGAIGMSIYGMGQNALSATQVHFLFAPAMSMFGIATVMVLWERFKVSTSLDRALGNVPLILIGLLSALPMILSLPNSIYTGLVLKKSYPNWPPYIPRALNRELHENTTPQNFIFSDQPWAVAWYADRKAVWLPTKLESILEIEATANRFNTSITGIHISPVSLGENRFYSQYVENQDLNGLVLDGWVAMTQGARGSLGVLPNSSPKLATMIKRYPYPLPLNGAMMVYYSSTIPKKIK